MLSLMLVDDEVWVCELLKGITDWEKLGYNIIAEAHEGEEAFNLIKYLKPDVVITDIRIPGIDGISLVEQARVLGLETDFIIISGYNDFEYARKAIRVGALDYILKPVEKTYIDELMAKTYKKVIKRKEKNDEENKIKDQLQASVSNLREKLFLDLMQEANINSEELKLDKINQKYGLNFREGIFQVVLFKVDSASDQSYANLHLVNRIFEILLKNIEKEMKELCHDLCMISIKNLKFACVLNFGEENKKTVQQCLSAVFEASTANLSNCFGLDLTAGVGSFQTGVYNLYQSYQTSVIAVRSRVVYGTKKIIRWSDCYPNSKETKDLLPMNKEMRIVNLIESFDLSGAKNFIEEQFSLYNNANPACAEAIFRLAHFFTDIIYRVIIEKHSDIEDEMISKSKALEEIEESMGIDPIISYLIALMEKSLDFYDTIRKRQNGKLIETVKAYISENYRNTITLNEAANIVFLNPSYLSDLFKKETGINFLSYLTNYRIEIAKELLADVRYRINEVADLVGYKDVDYFSKLFKKVVGINPVSYRKMYI